MVWRHWRARAKDLVDKRIGEEFADELRELLPETLLQINRDIARQYAGANLGFAAGQHCQLIQKSGFASETATLYCRTVVDGIKKRVLGESEAFQDQLQNSDVMSVTQRFESLVRRDLSLLTQIDPGCAYGSSAAREAAAREAAAREAAARGFHSAAVATRSKRFWFRANRCAF